MQPDIRSQSNPAFRLTALWALCESGLGGWMHALQLPFTGFFVGAFAVVIICLIGWFGQFKPRIILQATFLVVIVKALVSPQSPPPAYLAVVFQGAMGALLLRGRTSFRLKAIILAVMAMVESALQKLIILTILFGKSLWEAIDQFFQGLIKEFHLSPQTSFSFWIITVYTLIYTFWGVLIGWWAGGLPQIIEKNALPVLQQIRQTDNIPEPVFRKKSLYRKLAGYGLLLLFILLVILSGSSAVSLSKAGYIVLRTLVILGVLLLVINPLIRWFIRYKAQKQQNDTAVQQLLAALPMVRSYVRPAYALARSQKGWRRFTGFMLNLIVLTLYHPDIES